MEPLVFRNRRVAVSQSIGFSLLALLALGVGAIALRAVHSGAGRICILVGLLAILAVFGGGVVRSWRMIAVIDAGGIHTVNLLNRRRVEWSRLAGVTVGLNAADSTVWWVARLFLSDVDTVVPVGISYGHSPATATAFADAVRERAPAGLPTDDPSASVRVVPPASGPVPLGSPRYTVRAWSSWSGLTLIVVGWLPLALLGLIFGGIALADDEAWAGLIVIIVVLAATALLVRWSRPLLVVTPVGLRTRSGLRRRSVAWSDVMAVLAVGHLNRSGTQRRCALSVLTGAGTLPLAATDRPVSRAAAIHDRVMAFAPPTLARSDDEALARINHVD